MHSRTKKIIGLALLLCLPVTAGVASKKEPKRPLRYPFGLTPIATPLEAKTVLKGKGLAFLAETLLGTRRVVSWRLSGQISYKGFAPQDAAVVFEQDKLSSFSLSQGPIANCTAAQAVFVSAMDFLRDNYDRKDAAIAQEPAADVLDCGPHFASDNFTLRIESKTLMATALPERNPGHYRVVVTYQPRPPATKEDKESTPDKKQPAGQENL